MTLPTLSPDQAEAWDALAEVLGTAGIDLVSEEIAPPQPGKGRVMAVIGKAGSGKTMILAALTKALREAGLDEAEIVDLILSTALFGWANRLMHILGDPVRKDG